MHAHRSLRALTRIGVGAAALAAVVLTAAPAFATTGRIDSALPQPGGHLSVAFSALGLGPGETIDLSTVTVTINDQVTPSSPSLISSESSAPVRRTMLTIDVSGSMTTTIGAKTRIQAAKEAADTYLSAVPKDVEVGLVTFSDTATLVVAPTADHARVRGAVDALAATNGSTALFDGVVLANQSLGTTGQRNQLLLSDGANDRGTTLAAALASIKASKVIFDAVSIGSDAAGVVQLTALSTAGNGLTVTADNTTKLNATFESAATTQANQILIDVTVPDSLAGTSQNVVVSARAGAQTVGDRVNAIMPAAATGVPTSAANDYGPQPIATPDPGIAGHPWFLPVAVSAFGIGIFILLAVAIVSSDRENQTSGRMRRRLSRYSLSSRQEPKQSQVETYGALGQSQIARSAVELAGRVVQSRDLDTGLGGKLEAAGVPLKSAEWMLIHMGIAIVSALAFTFLSGFNLLATIIGLTLGIALPFTYLTLKESRRKARFAAQLPDTLQLIAGSLAAGYSLPQAIDAVTRDSEGPMASELNRALVEARLGVPIEDALETVGKRMDSVDFAWVVMAIRIQRDVGGNLAEVLTGVAATMRERERLRRQVQVLSAEGRLSAVILGAMPILFAAYLSVAQPQYVGLLVTTPIGIMMIVVGVILLIAGAFWLRKVVTVEV